MLSQFKIYTLEKYIQNIIDVAIVYDFKIIYLKIQCVIKSLGLYNLNKNSKLCQNCSELQNNIATFVFNVMGLLTRYVQTPAKCESRVSRNQATLKYFPKFTNIPYFHIHPLNICESF